MCASDRLWRMQATFMLCNQSLIRLKARCCTHIFLSARQIGKVSSFPHPLFFLVVVILVTFSFKIIFYLHLEALPDWQLGRLRILNSIRKEQLGQVVSSMEQVRAVVEGLTPLEDVYNDAIE